MFKDFEKEKKYKNIYCMFIIIHSLKSPRPLLIGQLVIVGHLMWALAKPTHQWFVTGLSFAEVIVLAVIMEERRGHWAGHGEVQTLHSYWVKGLIGSLKHSYLDIKGRAWCGVCMSACLCQQRVATQANQRCLGRCTSNRALHSCVALQWLAKVNRWEKDWL